MALSKGRSTPMKARYVRGEGVHATFTKNLDAALAELAEAGHDVDQIHFTVDDAVPCVLILSRLLREPITTKS